MEETQARKKRGPKPRYANGITPRRYDPQFHPDIAAMIEKESIILGSYQAVFDEALRVFFEMKYPSQNT